MKLKFNLPRGNTSNPGWSLISKATLAAAGIMLVSSRSSAEDHPLVDILKATQKQNDIFVMLSAWSADNGNKFPNEPGDANANFRMLFMARLVDMESLFALPQDGWCLKGKPDGLVGSEPDFAKALEPGEQSFTYVAGLANTDSSELPLMLSGAGPATGWITGVDKELPRVWFLGEVVVTFVNGKTEVLKPGPDGKIRKMRDGKMMDIFSPAYGTKTENIRLPAVPEKKVPEKK